ncbi:hypothetical protein DNTS_021383 [Danionella cerebrum]|uniref:Uncharacterized protein n=1 Tax=Danionella cerebrum TaxID=2873325 RepID=A0A553R0Y7_9TELE|nr:hypothetical protein DNTS_021383 [Danionella translucida]
MLVFHIWSFITCIALQTGEETAYESKADSAPKPPWRAIVIQMSGEKLNLTPPLRSKHLRSKEREQQACEHPPVGTTEDHNFGAAWTTEERILSRFPEEHTCGILRTVELHALNAAKGRGRVPAGTMSQADMTCSARQRVFQEALRKGNTKELHSLLQNMTNCEFNVNSFGPEGQTALHQSVIDGNLELVKLLVKFGADIRLANRDGWSALHIAAFGGHQDIALYLITRAKYSSSAL